MNYSILKKLKNPQTILSLVLQFSLVLLSVSYPLLSPKKANATLNTSFVRFDRQSAGAQLGGVVCEQSTQTAGGVSKVIVTFPSTFNLATSTWTVDTTAANLPNTSSGDSFTATAWPGITGPETVDNATKAAIFSSTDLTNASNTYCFHFTTTGSNDMGTAGNDLLGTVDTQTTGGTSVETFEYATSVLSGTNGEQIQVTATVSASFSFALSGGDASGNLPLGVLSSSTPVTAPYQVTGTVSTNARNGFLSWVKGTNTDGLHSTTAGGTGITSPGSYDGAPTDLTGATGYGLFAVTGTNSPTIAGEYDANDGVSVGHVDSTQYDLLASLTGQQSSTTFNIGVRAKPTSTQLAATDYSDTLTVIAAGSF